MDMQFNLFGENKILCSIDPARNRYRVYSLSLVRKPDQMFSVERKWWRLTANKNSALYKGRKTAIYSDYSKAQMEFLSLLRQKKRKGYVEKN